MVKIVVIFHSGYGHTKNQAEAVFSGLNTVDGVEGAIIIVGENGELKDSEWALLDEADGIIFGSPTYMGMVSWQFKRFADDSSNKWFEQKWKNKIGAGFTNSASINGDKHSTLHYMMTLAMQHGMIWVGTGIMPANTKSAQRDDLNYLGSFSGAMAQSPSDSGTGEAPTSGDLETAKLFGARVAEVTKQWNA